MQPRHALALLAIVAAGALLRFHGLDRESIWLDEAFSIEFVRRPFPDLLRAKDIHPPLYYVLLWGWTAAFGEHETAVRSLSAVFGVLALPAMYLVAVRLFGAGLALIPALLLAVSPYHVYYSQEARNYALLVLLTIASYAALLRWEATSRAGAAAAYVAATVAMVYTHVFALLTWSAQLLWALFRWRRPDRRSLVWLAPFGAVALSLLPWIDAPWTTPMLHQTDARTTGLVFPRPSLAALFLSFQQFAGSTLAAAIVLPLAALGAVRGRQGSPGTAEGADRRDRLILLLGWLLLPHLVPFLYSRLLTSVYITRATISSLPALYLLATAPLGRLGGRPRTLLVGAIVALSLSAQWLSFQGRSKEQWREVAAVVDRLGRPGDAVVFDAGYGRLGFDHYSRSAALRKVALSRDITSAGAASEVEQGVGDSRRLWLVRFQRSPDEEQVRRALSAWQPVTAGRFTGIDLYLLERATGR